MAEKTVESRIMDVLQALKPDAAPAVKPETDMFAAGILDSFGVLEYITALENEFKIKIPNEDLLPQNLLSVSASVKTIQKHLK